MKWSRHTVAMCIVAMGAAPAMGAPTAATADLKADRVVVAKAARTLTLVRNGAAFRTYPVALGARPTGHKQREGDERTPEGVYAIDARNPDSAYHLSLRISYPNEADRSRAVANGVDPGGQIMIHGIGPSSAVQPLHPLFDWTDGCVAVTDQEMEEIWDFVDVGTPVEIKP